MTITAAQIESYRRSWFPPGADTQERAMLFWRALGSPSLTASQGDERAELFRRVVGQRPTEFRSRTNPYQAEIGRALDGVLSRQARHRAGFDAAWRDLGYPDDPALKRRVFARVLPRLEAKAARWDAGAARRDLAAALARDDHRRRMEAASALARAQGRELARREHNAALLAALDRRTEAVRARKARLFPPGPIRLL